MEDGPPEGERLSGGQLLSAISNRIVAILREHYGRGPMRVKTYALDDLVVVALRGSGFTPVEQTMMDAGEPERVVTLREDFQRVMRANFSQAVEEITDRNVLAFLSRAHVEPDLAVEIFLVDRPLDGFGEVEAGDPA